MYNTYLYLDVYFLSNIIADAAVLLMFCFVMRFQTRLYRIISASVFGSVTDCVMTAFNIQDIVRYTINVVIAAIMLLIIAGRQRFTVEYLMKSVVLFYFIGFMLGGLLNGLAVNGCGIIMLGISAAVVPGVVYLVSGERGLSRFRQYNSDIYEVTLYRKNNRYEGTGYYDSGNGAREPLSGAPVIIGYLSGMDKFLTEGEKRYIKLFPGLPDKWDGETYIRGIPYNSLGNGKGMLPGIKIDRIDVRRKHKQKTYNNIYVGISTDKLSLNEKYDFILHRDMY